MKQKIYLAIPYTWNPEESFRIANIVAGKLMESGYRVFSPISHSHPIAKTLKPELLTNQEFWMNQDIYQVANADILAVVNITDKEGFTLIQNSKGVQQELTTAKALGMPIQYLDYKDLKPIEDE